MWLESVSIFAAVLLATSIQATCGYAKDKQFLKMMDESLKCNATVIRGQYGTSQKIDATQLVVGDVICLKGGDRVPADCILFEEQDMQVDEQKVLGCCMADGIAEKECLNATNKDENPNFVLLKDSIVMSGSGKALVLCVGSHTLIQKEACNDEFSTDGDLTPLQKKLEAFSELIGFYAECAAVISLFTLTLYWIFVTGFSGQGFISLDAVVAFIKNFQTALALLIVSVPEGMPLAISMAIAFSFEKLTDANVLILKPEALENSGILLDICTSKSNTLTVAKPSVKKLHIGTGNDFLDVVDGSYNEELKNYLADLLVMNTSAYLETDDKQHKYLPIGAPLEVALLNFLVDNNMPVHELFVKRERDCHLEATAPFSSGRMCMTVAYKLTEEDGEKVRVIVKGAPEVVIKMCSSAKNMDNETFDFAEKNDHADYLENVVSRGIAKEGLKPLTIAYKNIDIHEWESLKEKYFNFECDEARAALESNLTLAASFGFHDELRPNI